MWVHDGTHSRSGEDTITRMRIFVSFKKPIDAIVMDRGECKALSRRIEISSVCNSSSSNITTWQQRGTAVPFPDDTQSEGRSGGCVVHFYDPGFVLLHANRGIVTNPKLPHTHQRHILVHREPTRRRQTSVELDENRLDGRPSLITSHVGCD